MLVHPTRGHRRDPRPRSHADRGDPPPRGSLMKSARSFGHAPRRSVGAAGWPTATSPSPQ
jgi:hypothetical protein